jgi:hypothetical protein
MSIPRFLLGFLLLTAVVLLCRSSLVAQTSLYKYPTAASAQSQLDGLVAPLEFGAHVVPLSPDEMAKTGGIRTQRRSEFPMASNNKDCFVLRSYQVKRDNPNSDATTPVGYTDCQPAARYQMKVAVESR